MHYDTGSRFVAKTAIPAAQQGYRKTTQYIVIHHAAWTYPPGKACQLIFNYHSSKWPRYGRIGYHIVLQEEPSGVIAQYHVNPLNLVGANVAYKNHLCLGICAATNFKGLPSERWFDAVVAAAAYAKSLYPAAEIVGHKDIADKRAPTACPGPKWHEWRGALLTAVYNT